MSIIKEVLLNTGWIKPRLGEFNPEHEEFGIAYGAFLVTFQDSRRELERRPNEEEMVRDLMGRRIKEREQRLTSAAISASSYTPYHAGPHYFQVGIQYLFSLKSQRLLIEPAPGIRFDAEKLKDAPPEAWFEHGKTVVDSTLRHLSEFHGLPTYLARIQVPA